MIEDAPSMVKAPSKAVAGPKISIAMATYNGEKFILEQLNSLAAQTTLPAELIVTDDGSADRTLEIIRTFAQTAPFAVDIYPNPKRLGYAENFLRAASLCQGDLIAFCDQDDVWLPQKLAVAAAPFSDPEVLITGHTSRSWYGGDQYGDYFPRFKRFVVRPVAQADPLIFHLGFSTIIRRSILQIMDNHVRPPVNWYVAGSQEMPMAHDQWIWFLAAIFGKTVEIPDVLGLYRQHDNNVFGMDTAPRSFAEKLSTDKSGEFYKAERISWLTAAYLDEAAARLQAPLQGMALAAAGKVRRRARLCHLRGSLYDADQGMFARLGSFFTILRSRGYIQSDHVFCFGRKASLKDMVFGVLGVSRYFAKRASAKPGQAVLGPK